MKLVYVVDDSVFYQKIIQAYLNQMGYDVKTFISAKECLAELYLRPDLILLDQHLGEKEKGLDYLRKIKFRAPFIPIVFLSGDGDKETIAKAMRMGAFEYILKNEASLVRLRTTLDKVPIYLSDQSFRFKIWAVILMLLLSGSIIFFCTSMRYLF